jgi:hypothetical protein
VKPRVEQPENPLFTNGDNANMNACVGDNSGPYELFDYGKGFFEGGHAIVAAAGALVAPVDWLVYPAAFSYRHGIELLLKQLVLTLNGLLGSPEGFGKHHKMMDLWGAVVELDERIEHDLISDELVARAGALIGYFDAFDPTGQVLRYPEDIKGNRHLAEHKLINVEVLRDQMKELQDILEAWYYHADDCHGRQGDRAADARA